MKISPDDPRLTAYALGELDGAQRKVVEVELENSAECRRAVDEITRAAAMLGSELAAEPMPRFAFVPGAGRIRRVLIVGGALAAAVAVSGTLWVVMHARVVPGNALPRVVEAPKVIRVDTSDEAFERWAAPYRRRRIPMVTREAAAAYSPPEIAPVGPASNM